MERWVKSAVAISLVVGATGQTLAEETVADKFKPVVAVASVFASRFPGQLIDTRGTVAINVKNETTATIGDYTVARYKDLPCSYDLKRGAEKVAEINFDKLSNEYSVQPYSSQVMLRIPGTTGALCAKLSNPANGDVGCQDFYQIVAPSSRINEVLRSFRYIFAHVCMPVALF